MVFVLMLLIVLVTSDEARIGGICLWRCLTWTARWQLHLQLGTITAGGPSTLVSLDAQDGESFRKVDPELHSAFPHPSGNWLPQPGSS